mmetsp:Transcript_18137/g.30050  ORF Transcript_18137/g.30050 Transcript_18137/m.30050 type:complete len:507 (+) Transcript_18137:85-1605(+)
MNALYRLMMLSTMISFRSFHIRALVAAKSGTSGSAAATAATATSATSSSSSAVVSGVSHILKTPHELRVVQVQIVHRHGDRTPITPLLNESYWASELVPDELSQRVASSTTILRDDSPHKILHLAGGRGPFGKLTQLGLLQMVQVGTELREQLVLEEHRHDDATISHTIDEHGHVHWNRGRLFCAATNPLHPSKIKVMSTDFPRTIQSVQGTLVGLFPDPADTIATPITVDARHTNHLIPDPQPRQSVEQEELERSLGSRPHLRAVETTMKDLAMQTTQSLRHLLGDDAFAVSFGVGEENDDKNGTTTTTTTKRTKELKKKLSWAQLSEITKCLQTRDMLPASITPEMQQAISKHTAWRWFENLRHPRLAFLSMNTMAKTMIVQAMHDRIEELAGGGESSTSDDVPLLYLYSAHDSTLIGLLCAFRLEQPAEWPEYGSYFKVELIEAKPLTGDDEGAAAAVQYLVRFSLNGEVLRCKWEDCDEALHMIPVDLLSHYVSTKGATSLE